MDRSRTPLLSNDHGHVRTLTLHRPETRNALSAELIHALYDALEEADRDETIRAVVLTGTDPAFCAGVDLKEASRDGMDYFAHFETSDCVSRVGQMSTPIIGAVNGAAFTGGLEIALGCDFLIASDRALFADTHARVGNPAWWRHDRPTAARRWQRYGPKAIHDRRRPHRSGGTAHRPGHRGRRPRRAARAGCTELARQISEVPSAVMAGLKQIYVDGAATILKEALTAERRIATRITVPVDSLNTAHRAVTIRNHQQIDRGDGSLTQPT